ncbi:hypothetical protein Ae201684P_015711 [Aphanomyces euteiches]|nr:hypothetical protein Ae201684P_015711 [Aphanomyces euteiches]
MKIHPEVRWIYSSREVYGELVDEGNPDAPPRRQRKPAAPSSTEVTIRLSLRSRTKRRPSLTKSSANMLFRKRAFDLVLFCAIAWELIPLALFETSYKMFWTNGAAMPLKFQLRKKTIRLKYLLLPDEAKERPFQRVKKGKLVSARVFYKRVNEHFPFDSFS